MLSRVSVVPEADAQAALSSAARDLRRRAGSAGSQARGAGARVAACRARRRSSPRPPRRSWSTIFRARSTHPERFLNAHWLNPAYPRAAGRDVARQAHRSGGHGAAEGAAGRHRQGAGRVRGAAGLHRAAHPGARHERGRAHGRGRRRQRRRPRQGDQIRLRLPLRRARHAGIHRLGRRRHSLLREPLSDQGARTTSAMPRPTSSSATWRRAASACRPARLSQLRGDGRGGLSRANG